MSGNCSPREAIAANVGAIRPQLSRFVSFEGCNAAIIVNNGDWTSPVGYSGVAAHGGQSTSR